MRGVSRNSGQYAEYRSAYLIVETAKYILGTHKSKLPSNNSIKPTKLHTDFAAYATKTYH